MMSTEEEKTSTFLIGCFFCREVLCRGHGGPGGWFWGRTWRLRGLEEGWKVFSRRMRSGMSSGAVGAPGEGLRGVDRWWHDSLRDPGGRVVVPPLLLSSPTFFPLVPSLMAARATTAAEEPTPKERRPRVTHGRVGAVARQLLPRAISGHCTRLRFTGVLGCAPPDLMRERHCATTRYTSQREGSAGARPRVSVLLARMAGLRSDPIRGVPPPGDLAGWRAPAGYGAGRGP